MTDVGLAQASLVLPVVLPGLKAVLLIVITPDLDLIATHCHLRIEAIFGCL